LVCGFPFGLWEAPRPLEVTRPLLIWPRTFPVAPVPEADGGHADDGLALRDRAGNWGDPLGVRPYRRGDPLCRVHWGQTARHGELIVSEVQSSAVPRVQVVLDAHPAAHAGSGPGGSREWAVRVAASFAEGWVGQGADVELVLDGGSVRARGGSAKARSAALLDALARVGPGSRCDLAGLLDTPECRRFGGGLRVVITTDVGLAGLPPGAISASVDRFVVLRRGRSKTTIAGVFSPRCRSSRGSGSTAPGGSRRDSSGRERGPGLDVDEREDARVRWCTLLMTALATAALEQAVLEPGVSRWLALVTTLGTLVAPTLAASWLLAGRVGLGAPAHLA
jgi:hypothetical protein